MTRAGDVEMFNHSLGPIIDEEAWRKREPQAWGTIYQDTGVQFLKLYFPNIHFPGAARRWCKDVSVEMILVLIL